MSMTGVKSNLYPYSGIYSATEAATTVGLKAVDRNALTVQRIINANETQKQHYEKIRSKWSYAEKIVVAILYTDFIITSMAFISLPAAGIENSVIFKSLGSISAGCGVFATILLKYFNKKKRSYSMAIALYNKRIDQAYILLNKAISDNVITDDELEQLNTINNKTTLTAEEQQQQEADDAKGNPDIEALEHFKGLILTNLGKVKTVGRIIKPLDSAEN